jgi:hypothetical protein
VKLVILVSMLLGLAIFSSVSMAGYQDYKCYIDSNSKGKEIQFYRWKAEKKQINQIKLSAKRAKDKQGNNYYINSAKECVLATEDFTDENAKILDKQTLR